MTRPWAGIPTNRAIWLWAAVSLVAVFGFVTPALGLVALGLDVIVLIAVLIDLRRAGQTALQLERLLPPVAHQGEPMEVVLLIDNPNDHPLGLRIREVLSPALSADPVALELELPARSRARLPYTVRPLRRGRSVAAPLALRVRGPLGLAWADRALLPDQSIRVYPRAHLEGQAGLVVRQALRQRAGANPRERRGLSTELYALREYQNGDPMRSIHWRASARRGMPVTRETCWEQHQHIVILLDCGRPMSSLADDLNKLDHALAAVLALMRVTLSQNDHATLVLFSQDVRRVVTVDRRTASFHTVFEAVHDLEADQDEPDYTAAVAWCARKVPRRSLVLVVTSVLDALGAERLQGALKGLAARHRPLLVNLEDPGLMAHARSIPEEPLEAYAKTSAMAMLARISGLTRALREQGVDVVSMPASELAIGMIDRYLAFKARRGM